MKIEFVVLFLSPPFVAAYAYDMPPLVGSILPGEAYSPELVVLGTNLVASTILLRQPHNRCYDRPLFQPSSAPVVFTVRLTFLPRTPVIGVPQTEMFQL